MTSRILEEQQGSQESKISTSRSFEKEVQAPNVDARSFEKEQPSAKFSTFRSFEKNSQAPNLDVSIIRQAGWCLNSIDVSMIRGFGTDGLEKNKSLMSRSFEEEQPSTKSRRLDHSKITAKRQISTFR